MVETVVIVLIVGGWLWALAAARDGRAVGVIALLAFAAFDVLIGLYVMQYVLHTRMHWPEMTIVLVTLIAGLIAVGAVGMRLRADEKRA